LLEIDAGERSRRTVVSGNRAEAVEREALTGRRDGRDGARPASGRGAPLSSQARSLLPLQQSAGNRAVTGLVERVTPSRVGALGHTVVQRLRTEIPRGAGANITLAALQAKVVEIDTEIAELQAPHPEIDLAFIDMTRVNNWRAQLTVRLTTLQNLNPGAANYTQDQIKARDTPLMNAFYDVAVTVSNLAGALNKSLADYRSYKTNQDLITAAEDERKKYDQASTGTGPYVSPYTTAIDKYDSELGGAPILVDDHFVAVVEHYQLKHNANLGILQDGGPFIGKKGSSMPGGWDAHRSTYAPQVLEFAKIAVAKLDRYDDSTKINLAKQRTNEIEAYITITRDGEDWLVSYHCNPPK
jgi:hypothetical protein